jgi:hypothetical protein
MGKLYGQRSRLLLNRDAVFLGELLSLISNPTQSPFYWDASYQSYNCFSLPETRDKMPISLQFVATVNLILSEVKLDDNLMDSNFFLWKLVRQFLSKSFRKASARMKEWNFPLRDLWQWVNIQKQREKNVEELNSALSVDEKVDYWAEPTAKMTGLTFLHGARVSNNEAIQQTMYNVGYSFGKLIYLLDAFEDYKKDYRKKHFNAWRAAYDISNNELPEVVKNKIVKDLIDLHNQIVIELKELPTSKAQIEMIIERLKESLSLRLPSQLNTLQRSSICVPKRRMTIREKWILAKRKAYLALEKQGLINPGSTANDFKTSLYLASYTAFIFFFQYSSLIQDKTGEFLQGVGGCTICCILAGVCFCCSKCCGKD